MTGIDYLKAGVIVKIGIGEYGIYNGECIVFKDSYMDINGLNNDLLDIDGEHDYSVEFLYEPTITSSFSEICSGVFDSEIIWEGDFSFRQLRCDFTSDETTILESLDDAGYQYLARDDDGVLFAYYSKPSKMCGFWGDSPNSLNLAFASRLFQSISEPVKITDCLA